MKQLSKNHNIYIKKLINQTSRESWFFEKKNDTLQLFLYKSIKNLSKKL